MTDPVALTRGLPTPAEPTTELDSGRLIMLATPQPVPSLLPGRLRVLITGVIVGGAATVVASLLATNNSAPPAAWRMGLAAVAAFLGDLTLLHIRFGHDRHSFTWSETFIVLGLVLIGGPWLPLVAAPGVALAHVVTRRAPIKVAFNGACSIIGIALACVVFSSLRPETGGGLGRPFVYVALAAGSFSFFIWNGLLVSTAVAFSQGKHVREVYLRGFMLNLMVWVGNTVAGLTVVAIAQWQPGVLIVLPLFVGLLFLAYQAYLRAMQESETWQVLQAASRELIQPRQADVAGNVLDRASSLFQAEFVEIMVCDGEPGEKALVFRRHGSEAATQCEGHPLEMAASFWPRAFSERELFMVTTATAPAAQKRDLAELGLAMCWVAPLVTAHGCLGTLRIGFRGRVRMRPRELQVLSTFANHVSTSLYNARLFEDVNEEQAKLSRILSHSSDGILSVDSRGLVTSWNPAMERITGRSAEEALRTPLFDGFDAQVEGGGAVTPDWLNRRMEKVGQFETDVLMNQPGASSKWLQISVAPIRSVDGSAESAMAVVRDITALREVEEAKQDFLATVSHELRTPLTTLKGYVITLMRPGYSPDPDEFQNILSRMLRNSRRLERLIEDVLSVSHLERGDFTVDNHEFDVDEVVSKVVADFTLNCPGRPIEYTAPEEPIVAVADPGRVEQVVSNLLSNSDRYSPPERAIRLTMEADPAGMVIRVTDQGPGIPEDKHEVIFERFSRLGHHLTREQGGTGLGLYITRVLVEAMGGSIWVESKPGEGATFAFTLPVAQSFRRSGE